MGRERRKEGENDGVPSYDTSVQGHTKRGRKGLPAMTKASRDTQARRKGKKGERERDEEGKRRREKEEGRCSQQASSGPECYIREHPKRQRGKRGRVGGGRELRP